jgi:hypothetical protein
MNLGAFAFGFLSAWIEKRKAKRRRKKRFEELGIPFEEDMMLKGKLTYTGIAVTAVSVVLGWFGVGDEAAAAQIVQHGAELVGLVIALYGRYRASQA